MKTCKRCGQRVMYAGSTHDGSHACVAGGELRKISKRGLIAVSSPAPITGHTNRTGTIAVCKILGLDYQIIPSKTQSQPWVCVTPEVEATLRAVKQIAQCTMLVIPEAARRLVDRRELLIEFDTMKRLGAEDGALFDILALAGVMGERAQFEARCTQKIVSASSSATDSRPIRRRSAAAS